jgi:hypothetical protein
MAIAGHDSVSLRGNGARQHGIVIGVSQHHRANRRGVENNSERSNAQHQVMAIGVCLLYAGGETRRPSTSSSSASSAGLVNKSIAPERAASRIRRGAPRQSRPETRMLVSVTTFMSGASLRPSSPDFGFDIGVCEWRLIQVCQTVGRVE